VAAEGGGGDGVAEAWVVARAAAIKRAASVWVVGLMAVMAMEGREG